MIQRCYVGEIQHTVQAKYSQNQHNSWVHTFVDSFPKSLLVSGIHWHGGLFRTTLLQATSTSRLVQVSNLVQCPKIAGSTRVLDELFCDEECILCFSRMTSSPVTYVRPVRIKI